MSAATATRAAEAVPGDAVPAAEPGVLETCRAGTDAWHLVVQFDLALPDETFYVQTGVARLALVDRAAAFRIRAAGPGGAVQHEYSLRTGWYRVAPARGTP